MEILMAITTSLVASIVFYFCFQFVPERRRYRRIRPRIEVELMEITDQLFFYLEIPLKHDIHFASAFQRDIKENQLNKEKFEIGLYNKCLNESYLFDKNAEKLIVVGRALQTNADQISGRIRQTILNQHYLTTEEILIIEDIDRLLYTHLYEDNAFEKIGNQIVHPVNPTISYMGENFNKLYILWNELRHLMYRYNNIRKENRQGRQRYFTLQWEYIEYLFRQKEYKQAKKTIRKLSSSKWSAFQVSVINSLKLRLEFEVGHYEQAKAHTIELLKSRNQESPIYYRSLLDGVQGNDKVMKIITSVCPDDVMKAWNSSVAQENSIKNRFLNQNQQLKHYYEKQIRELPKNVLH